MVVTFKKWKYLPLKSNLNNFYFLMVNIIPVLILELGVSKIDFTTSLNNKKIKYFETFI